MDIISILGSISKLAVLAFVVTFGFIIVELYLMSRKQERPSEQEVTVPEFSQNGNKQELLHIEQPKNIKSFDKKENKLIKPAVNLLIVIIIIGILSGSFYVYNRYVKPQPIAEIEPFPTIVVPTAPVEFIPDEITDEEIIDEELPDEEIIEDEEIVDENITPTESLESTPIPTAVLLSTTPSVTSIEDGSDPEEGVVTQSPQTSATATPAITLPQAGTYHLQLMIAVAALSIMVLAFIL